MALANLYKARHKEGLESLNTALRIDPNLALAHKLVGLTYLAMEKRDLAMEKYEFLKSLNAEMATSLLTAIQRPDKFRFGVVHGKVISIPKPEYPAAARAKGLTARIEVDLWIDEEGKVTSARALNGPMELQQAAAAAALKIRYTPTLLSGTPVAVRGRVHYNFGP